MKQLGAIAALGDIVAFNTEVADELRAVFDDFRSTRYGQGFEADDIENFKTDEVGQSSLALYNKPGQPEFSLRIEIQSSGTADISINRIGPEPATGDPELPLGFESGATPDVAAAKVLGAILDFDQSSSFGKNFRSYVQERLGGRAPIQAPEMDFPGKDLS